MGNSMVSLRELARRLRLGCVSCYVLLRFAT
jgi:hypothetical protein